MLIKCVACKKEFEQKRMERQCGCKGVILKTSREYYEKNKQKISKRRMELYQSKREKLIRK